MRYTTVILIITGIILTILTARGILGEIKLYKMETQMKQEYGHQRTYDSLIAGIIVWPLTWGIYIYTLHSFTQ